MTEIDLINSFMSHLRLALIGVSHSPKHFSRAIMREFVARVYEITPVNPNVHEVEGAVCVGHIRDIHPPVEAALIVTAPSNVEQVAKDCAEAGIHNLWIYRMPRNKEVSERIIAICRDREISLIMNRCPLMFLQNAAYFHRVHRFFSKLVKAYPK